MGGRCKLLEFFVLSDVYIGLVTMFLYASNKTNAVLCLQLSISMETCHTFKCQSLEKRLSCGFQAIGNILLQRCRASAT